MQATQKILIIGSGSLAKVYGGFLRRRGYEVTCLVRNLAKAKSESWALESFSGKRFEVSGVSFIDAMGQLSFKPDVIFVTTRHENLADVMPVLRDAEMQSVPIFIFCPVLSLESIPQEAAFKHLHVIIPGVVAYPRDGLELFTAKKSVTTTLRGDAMIAKNWARQISDAGVPVVFRKNYLRKILLPSAVLLVCFALIELAHADYKKLSGNQKLLRHASQLIHEMAQGTKAAKMGCTYGIEYLPPAVTKFVLQLVFRLMPRVYKDMLAHHTVKVSLQTRLFLNGYSKLLLKHQQSSGQLIQLADQLQLHDQRGQNVR